MATIAEVAKHAGVSKATVSRVLANSSVVREGTARKVLDVCKRLNFTPSASGRLLASGTDAVVGLSLGPQDLSDSRYVSRLHQELSIACQNKGLLLRLIEGDFTSQTNKIGSAILIGVVPSDPRIAHCKALGIPFVIIGYCDDPKVPSLVPDDWGGGKLAFDHLKKFGAKLGIAFYENSIVQKNNRFQGFVSAAKSKNIQVECLPIANQTTPVLDGFRFAKKNVSWLKRQNGIFVETDELAYGIEQYFKFEICCSPPKIVGFDGFQFKGSKIASISQDFQLSAQKALELIAGRNCQFPLILPVHFLE